jgi:hypothetical protein
MPPARKARNEDLIWAKEAPQSPSTCENVVAKRTQAKKTVTTWWRREGTMNGFDKLCACLSIPIGIVFMLLGIIGLFAGSGAHFTLPPILGCLPFFLGWSMSITLMKFWSRSGKNDHFSQKDPASDYGNFGS